MDFVEVPKKRGPYHYAKKETQGKLSIPRAHLISYKEPDQEGEVAIDRQPRKGVLCPERLRRRRGPLLRRRDKKVAHLQTKKRTTNMTKRRPLQIGGGLCRRT